MAAGELRLQRLWGSCAVQEQTDATPIVRNAATLLHTNSHTNKVSLYSYLQPTAGQFFDYEDIR